MGAARRAAVWRNSQQNQEMNMGVYYLFLFVLGFVSWGITWIAIPIIVAIQIFLTYPKKPSRMQSEAPVTRRTSPNHPLNVNYW